MSNCPCELELEFEDKDEDLELEIYDGESGDILPYYKGPYVITPKVEEQVVETSEKSMSKDLKIEGVPYSEVSNLSGGITVNIAFIR